MLPEADKPALNAWLAEQPLVLANQDLRIVHAAWLPESLATLEAAVGEDLIAQYRRYDDELVHALQTASWYGDYLREQEKHAEALENADMPPPPMPATAQYELARSRLHPIRALTSGAEVIAPAPFTPAAAGATPPAALGGAITASACRCWWGITGAIGIRAMPTPPAKT